MPFHESNARFFFSMQALEKLIYLRSATKLLFFSKNKDFSDRVFLPFNPQSNVAFIVFTTGVTASDFMHD